MSAWISHGWTPVQIEGILADRAQGLTYEQIGARWGRSRSAIAQAIAREHRSRQDRGVLRSGPIGHAGRLLLAPMVLELLREVSQ